MSIRNISITKYSERGILCLQLTEIKKNHDFSGVFSAAEGQEDTSELCGSLFYIKRKLYIEKKVNIFTIKSSSMYKKYYICGK